MKKEPAPIVIWTPQLIYSDKHLSGNAKWILAEILNLFKVGGTQCWASNGHFADMFGLKNTNVSYHIQQLEKLGWITSKATNKCQLEECTLKDSGGHRHIYPGVTLSKILDTLSSKTGGAIQNIGTPLQSVGTISNTIENNIENNNGVGITPLKKYSSFSDLLEEDFEQISLDYKVPLSFVKLQAEKLNNYCSSKGKRYKNYKSALRNFVLGDAQRIAEKEKSKGSVYDATNIG